MNGMLGTVARGIQMTLLALMIAGGLLAGIGGPREASANYASGCYSDTNGYYYFYFDGATWYLLIDQLSGMPTRAGSANSVWTTWDTYAAAHGQSQFSLVSISCAVGYYIIWGLNAYWDGATVWIQNGDSWITAEQYLALTNSSGYGYVGGWSSSSTGNATVDGIVNDANAALVDIWLQPSCDYRIGNDCYVYR